MGSQAYIFKDRYSQCPQISPSRSFVSWRHPTSWGPFRSRGQPTSHRFPQYNHSTDQGPPLYLYAHTLLQDLLVLDMGPHALRYTLQNLLEVSVQVLPNPSNLFLWLMCCSSTNVISSSPLSRPHLCRHRSH
jgi:hypothetical protein